MVLCLIFCSLSERWGPYNILQPPGVMFSLFCGVYSVPLCSWAAAVVVVVVVTIAAQCLEGAGRSRRTSVGCGGGFALTRRSANLPQNEHLLDS